MGTKLNVDDCIEYIGFGSFHIRMTILLGFFFLSEALELTYISLLGPFIMKDFKISATQMAFLSMTFSAGMTVGSLLWGILADRLGRKVVLLLICIFAAYMSVLSMFAPNYTWVVAMNSIVGCATGGILSISTTYFIEMTPTGKRPSIFGLLVMLKTLGPLLVVGIAAAVYDKYGWRPVGLSLVIPLTLGVLLLFTVPPSPRFLALIGDVAGTRRSLLRMAKENGADLKAENIKFNEKKETTKRRFDLRDLFAPELRQLTISQMFLWFVAGFALYGAILLITIMATLPYRCLQDRSQMWIPNDIESDTSCGTDFNGSFFQFVALSSLGAIIPGFIICIFGNLIGRKWLICLFCMVGAISFVAVDFCLPNIARQLIFTFIRASTKGLYVMLFLYTGEVYPTVLRGTAVGLCSAMSRIGFIITPFAAQLLVEEADMLVALSLYSLLLFISAIVSLKLPYETVNMGLVEDVDEGVANAEQMAKYGSIPTNTEVKEAWDTRRGSIKYRRKNSQLHS